MPRPGFPVSDVLAWRILAYLNIFRGLIAVLMMTLLIPGRVVGFTNVLSQPLAQGAGLVYLLLAVYLEFERRRRRLDVFVLAERSITVDIIMGAVMVWSLGGLASGVGLLLVFAATAAAMLLPRRQALFFAASATVLIIMISAGINLGGVTAVDVPRAGFYGLACFFGALGGHALVGWARDYQILAERRGTELLNLARLNELVIRRMRTGVVIVDEDCRIQLMNESAWSLLGEPVARQQHLSMLAPELYQVLKDWLANGQQDDEPVLLGRSGIRIIPRLVQIHETGARALIFLDNAETLNRRAKDMAATSLARLSGSIAHEIRNPLAAISHSAQLLEESELEERQGRLVSILTRHARRMNQIVENVLQISRREFSHPEPIHLNTWLEEFRDEFQSFKQRLDLKIVLQPYDQDMEVLFDPSQLHQLLWKLVENSVEHAGAGEQTPRVDLILDQRADGRPVIMVRDNGPGIPTEHLDDIFEPFFTTRKEGSGLGLYVARQLCEANGADLRVNSDEGACFSIVFPPQATLSTTAVQTAEAAGAGHD